MSASNSACILSGQSSPSRLRSTWRSEPPNTVACHASWAREGTEVSIAVKVFRRDDVQKDKEPPGISPAAQCLGGGRGIRTLDRDLSPYNGLANRRLQPLGHPSAGEQPIYATAYARRPF